MKKLTDIIKNDLYIYYKYHIIHIITAVSIIFAFTIGLTNFLPPMIYIYMAVFIVPVLTFSISLFIGENHKSNKLHQCPPGIYSLGKILSAVVLQLIPLISFLIVLIGVLSYEFNVFLFLLVYLLGSALHIVIGLSLSIIAKSQFSLSMAYLVYLIVFSVIPIFYSVDMIPNDIKYILIISPAYLSGVLFEAIVHPSQHFEHWFAYLSVFLQLAYLLFLYYFVIKPFSDQYLKSH